MKVTAIMATCGRHKCLERSVRLFLNQDYSNKELIIYNNSEVPLVLDKQYDNIKLINCCYNLSSGERYKNLGEIYTDAIKFVSKNTDCIIFWDDDDLFLPNHISEGIKGLNEALTINKIAYKPKRSFNKYQSEPLTLVENTLEPSIFTLSNHILKHGFSNVTTEQHLKWVNPLVTDNLIYVKEDGIPTLIYNWGDTFFTFKTSGDFGNPDNFDNYRKFSVDHGDYIITPIETFDYDKYFK